MPTPTRFSLYSMTTESIRCEYDRVHTYRFIPRTRIEFAAGQYCHLVAPGQPPDRSTVRHMSIASAPEDGFIEISMDLGTGSPYKDRFAGLRPGDRVEAFHITGGFTLERFGTPSTIVCIAGGIGITPIRGLLRHIEARGLPVEWTLVHVGRNHLYESELAELGGRQYRIGRGEIGVTLDAVLATSGGGGIPASDGGVRLRFSGEVLEKFRDAVSPARQEPRGAGMPEPSKAAPPEPQEPRGAGMPVSPGAIRPSTSDTIFYVSGSSGLIDSVTAELSARGIDGARIAVEDFDR